MKRFIFFTQRVNELDYDNVIKYCYQKSQLYRDTCFTILIIILSASHSDDPTLTGRLCDYGDNTGELESDRPLCFLIE